MVPPAWLSTTYTEGIDRQAVPLYEGPQLAGRQRARVGRVELGEHVLKGLRHEATLLIVRARVGAVLRAGGRQHLPVEQNRQGTRLTFALWMPPT